MDDSKKKRRLPLLSDSVPTTREPSVEASEKKLMNEVLPDPLQAKVHGSARKRTLERLHRLVAIAAATAAIGAGCEKSTAGRGYGVVDPMPQPFDAGATAVVPDVPEPPQTGYGVVDPMPTPARPPPIVQDAGASLPDVPTVDAGRTRRPTPPPAYGVVDPMPNPPPRNPGMPRPRRR